MPKHTQEKKVRGIRAYAGSSPRRRFVHGFFRDDEFHAFSTDLTDAIRLLITGRIRGGPSHGRQVGAGQGLPARNAPNRANVISENRIGAKPERNISVNKLLINTH